MVIYGLALLLQDSGMSCIVELRKQEFSLTERLSNCLSKQKIERKNEKKKVIWFYGISTTVGYLIPNPVFTNILKIYDL